MAIRLCKCATSTAGAVDADAIVGVSVDGALATAALCFVGYSLDMAFHAVGLHLGIYLFLYFFVSLPIRSSVPRKHVRASLPSVYLLAKARLWWPGLSVLGLAI
jgi:hypothetical protein